MLQRVEILAIFFIVDIGAPVYPGVVCNISLPQAIYGKAEIGYRNFLYADVTGRIDWFSTLVGTSKEYVCYPSAGLSVILSEILPLPEKIISFWKIRGSYAQVGNPPSAYLPYATVALENGNATSANFTPASHLKPEMTKAFEFGMDLRLFQNKLNIAATYYNSNTYNQLFKYELPPSTQKSVDILQKKCYNISCMPLWWNRQTQGT